MPAPSKSNSKGVKKRQIVNSNASPSKVSQGLNSLIIGMFYLEKHL